MSPLTLSLLRVTLIDFTLSNARQFYSSMGASSGMNVLFNNIYNLQSNSVAGMQHKGPCNKAHKCESPHMDPANRRWLHWLKFNLA